MCIGRFFYKSLLIYVGPFCTSLMTNTALFRNQSLLMYTGIKVSYVSLSWVYRYVGRFKQIFRSLLTLIHVSFDIGVFRHALCVFRHASCITSRTPYLYRARNPNFSKILKSQLYRDRHCKLSSELTFENFYQPYTLPAPNSRSPYASGMCWQTSWAMTLVYCW